MPQAGCAITIPWNWTDFEEDHALSTKERFDTTVHVKHHTHFTLCHQIRPVPRVDCCWIQIEENM